MVLRRFKPLIGPCDTALNAARRSMLEFHMPSPFRQSGDGQTPDTNVFTRVLLTFQHANERPVKAFACVLSKLVLFLSLERRRSSFQIFPAI